MGISRVSLVATLTALLAAGCGTVPAVPGARVPSAPVTSSPFTSTAPTPTPTPAAPRRGTTLLVVGLGDSVTSGEHCDCDDYVTGFGRLLARHDGAPVHTVDDGESGSTSDGLADELSGHDADDRRLQSDVSGADVVVLTMGANDLNPALTRWRAGSCTAACYDPEVAQMQSDLDRVVDRVDALGDGRARVLVTSYWNVFLDGRVARDAERRGYLGWSDTVTRRADAAIAQVASTHAATLVDLYTPFKGDGSTDPTDLLAADGDHPDEAGTAVISRAVLSAYETGR